MAAILGWLSAGQNLGLACEPRHAVGVLGEPVGNDLDGHLAAQLGVGGAVHLAHTAFPELSGDAVVGDGGR